MRSGAPRLVACALACALPAYASAAPSAKVTIESDPPEAKVYLGAIEDGVKCEKTPCTFDAPLGESTAIVVLEGYEPDIVPLELKRRGKFTFKSKLHRSMGTLTVDGARGVAVQINDADGNAKGNGNVPHTFDLPAGEYTVVLSQNGKSYDTEVVEIDSNQDARLTAKAPEVAIKPPPAQDPDPGEEDLGDGSKVAVKKQAPPKPPRGTMFSIGVDFDFAYRKFTYDMGVPGTNTAQYTDGEPLLGPVVEIWPAAILGTRTLGGLSLYGRLALGVHSNTLAVNDGMTSGDVTTKTMSYEGSVRYRWVFGGVFGVEASAGYVRDSLGFGGASNFVDYVPPADYQSLRLGARFAYLAGSIEPYVGVEGRFVLSGGDIQMRFQSSSATGFHGALGVVVRLGPLAGRVEGAVTQYAWDFTNDSTTPAYQTDGGTDLVLAVSTSLAYQY